jgi:hypothetical protein
VNNTLTQLRPPPRTTDSQLGKGPSVEHSTTITEDL